MGDGGAIIPADQGDPVRDRLLPAAGFVFRKEERLAGDVDRPGGGGDHRNLWADARLTGGDALHGVPAVGSLEGPPRGSAAVAVPVVHPGLLGQSSAEEVAQLGHGDRFLRFDVLPHTRAAGDTDKVKPATGLW